MELSPFGHEQAGALASYLQRIPFHAIYASPMKRVQQTLSRLIANQNRLPVILRGLREVDFGIWTGLSWEEVAERYQISPFKWLEQLEHSLISEAENPHSFRERISQCLDLILADCPGKTVAVVCHGGVIRMILSILLELPLKKTASFEIEYASITTINYLPHKKEIELLNFTPWRDLA
jgi:broad specificity phosphatase PhoE